MMTMTVMMIDDEIHIMKQTIIHISPACSYLLLFFQCELYVQVPAPTPPKNVFFFSVALRPNAGHGLLILEVS